MFYRVTPLSAGFMLTSILGGIISAFYITNLKTDWAHTWGFTLFLFFTLMFISSMISMTYAPIEVDLDVRERKRKILK